MFSKNIFIATSIYPSKDFDRFVNDFFQTLCNQTYKNFTCIFFLDCIDYKKIQDKISVLKSNGIESIIFEQKRATLSPQSIRHLLIQEAQKYDCDLLILFDFDETSDTQRIKNTIQQIGEFDFAYNSFYITDSNLKKMINMDFFSLLAIPSKTTTVQQIVDFNYIGLGSLAIRPKRLSLELGNIPDVLAYDWFLVTLILLQRKSGTKINNTFVNYRQHTDSYVGFGRPLNQQSLKLGVQVKKKHYSFFKQLLPEIFSQKDEEICELEEFLKKNQWKYIKIINEKFNPYKLCWWENIKTLEEIKQWI